MRKKILNKCISICIVYLYKKVISDSDSVIIKVLSYVKCVKNYDAVVPLCVASYFLTTPDIKSDSPKSAKWDGKICCIALIALHSTLNVIIVNIL